MPAFGARDLSVVIPTRHRWPILRQTLAGLRAQTVQGFGVTVVVDGEDDDIPELDVDVVVKPHGGPGAARNAGARATDAPLLLFLGDDMIPSETFLECHLARHNRDPDIQVGVLGHVQWHPDVAADPLARWLDWSATQFDYQYIEGDDAGFGRFFSCNVSLKRSFFLDAGGFDEDFTYYYEDLDCGWRLNDKGLRLLYEPRAVTRHLHRYDWTGMERRFEGIAKGERLMLQKHPEFEPWFKQRVERARRMPHRSLVWPLIEPVPMPTSLRHRVRARANVAYYQRLAPGFVNAWQADRDLEDLKAYLGDKFDEDRFHRHRELVDAEEEEAGDEATFYRTSEAYLYDLTAFASWATKVPYLEAVRRFVPAGSRVLDYGCGIGNDGLRLLDDGYQVAFADFDNPSTAYLRWRLQRRGHTAEVYDVEQHVPGGFDAAFSFDVIEHVEDPWGFLAALEERARIVAVNLLEDDHEDTHLHKPLPITEMLDHAAERGLLWYRKYYGRSHLMIYRSAGVRDQGAAGGSTDVADRGAPGALERGAPGPGAPGLLERGGPLRSRVERLVGGRLPTVGPAKLFRLQARGTEVLDHLRRRTSR